MKRPAVVTRHLESLQPIFLLDVRIIRIPRLFSNVVCYNYMPLLSLSMPPKYNPARCICDEKNIGGTRARLPAPKHVNIVILTT